MLRLVRVPLSFVVVLKGCDLFFFRAISNVSVKIMATRLKLHLRLRGAGWTMTGLNHSRGHKPRLLSISKDPHKSENNPNVRLGVKIIIFFCVSAFLGGLRLQVLKMIFEL